MRHPDTRPRPAGACALVLAACAMLLAGCQPSTDAEVSQALKDVNVIDESNLNDIMLTVSDPNEGVAYFRKTADANPGRIDLQRGLARSLMRAQRPAEALPVWDGVLKAPAATDDDRVGYADALIRANEWKRAEAALNAVPPTVETYERYRLEAMVADANKNWKKADSFYEIAAGLTRTPAGVYNNWGFSKLSRGDYAGAEKLFVDAVTYDPKLFTAKNNLVLARGAQRKYDLPVLDVTQTERAQLLYTMGLAAIKQGDVRIGKGLLQQAIDTSPQHFDAAVQSLAALDANVTN